MSYLFSGFALVVSVLLAFLGKFFWALLMLLFSVWMFNWPQKKREDSTGGYADSADANDSAFGSDSDD
jgi:hypothetical protein